MSRGLVIVVAVLGFLFHAAAVPYKSFHHPQTILLSNISTNTNTEQLEGSRRVHQFRFNTFPALPLTSSNKEESMDDAIAIAKANDEERFHRMASAPLLERLQHHLEHLHKQLGEVEDLGADVDKVVEGHHASKDPGTNVDDKLEGHASNLLEEVEDHALNLADIIHSLNQTISNIEASQLPTEEARKIFSSITLALAKLDKGGAGLASGLEVVQREDDEERKNQHKEKVVDKVKEKEKEHEEKVVDKVKEEKHKEKVIDKMKDEEHNEEVVDKVKEEVEKVEATLADGLSIFAGWPNFCKILW